MSLSIADDVAWFRNMARLCLGEAKRLRDRRPKASKIAAELALAYRRQVFAWPRQTATLSTTPEQPWTAPPAAKLAAPRQFDLFGGVA